ncbi:MAG: thioester domain-containing protein, partial [Defluviitaleaceae bacterium]|nr:thioester domain-containing protein [Defluviitaleaceae bacterium]
MGKLKARKRFGRLMAAVTAFVMLFTSAALPVWVRNAQAEVVVQKYRIYDSPFDLYDNDTEYATPGYYWMNILENIRGSVLDVGAPFQIDEIVIGSSDNPLLPVGYCVSFEELIDYNYTGYFVSVPPEVYFNSGYHGTIKEKEKQIRWLVTHGYKRTMDGTHDRTEPAMQYLTELNSSPYLGTINSYMSAVGESFNLLTVQEAIIATQAAIWHYSDSHRNPVLLSIHDTTASFERTNAFYEALVDLAETYKDVAPAPPISLDLELTAGADLVYVDNGGSMKMVLGPISLDVAFKNNVYNASTDDSIEVTLLSNDSEIEFSWDADGLNKIPGGKFDVTVTNAITANQEFYIIAPETHSVKDNITITAHASAYITLGQGLWEPVVFVATDNFGKPDFSISQAIIAAVPGVANINSYADITIPVIPSEVDQNHYG